MTEKETAEKLRRLQAENRKLRRENEYLRHRAEQLGDRTAAHGNEDAVMRDAVRNLSVSRSRTYFGYLMLSLKSSRTFRVYDKTSFAVRNLFFASKLWRIITGVAAFLGIGAQVILTLGILAVLLPAAAVFSAAAAFAGFFLHRKWNRAFEKIFAGRRLYVLFAPKKKRGSGYFATMAEDFSKDGIVIVVSRSLAYCGFSGARAVRRNVYLVHTSYYFLLAKRFGLAEPARVIKIT